MARKGLVILSLAMGVWLGAAQPAAATGGKVPRVMYYPYYYPPFSYSAQGPYYSSVYPYYATYYYPFYAPYYPVYPTAYVGPGAAVRVYTPTVPGPIR